MSGAGPARELAASLGDALAQATAAGEAGPGVVGVGIDVVDLPRFRAVLARRPGMAERLCTPGERAYAAAVPDPVPRLATRFAAKEAAMKALGVGLGAFAFWDVEVVRHGLEAPGLVVSGAAADMAAEARVGRWHLALSHSDLVAAAVVVAVALPPAVWV